MAGHHGSAPRADSGLIGPTEAAALLGVSQDLVRKRTNEGLIPVQKTQAGTRRYERTDIEALIGSPAVARRAPGVQRGQSAEPLRLSLEDERNCKRIAEAAARTFTNKIPALDYDDALSDAMFGVAVAIAYPSNTVPWNVSAWNHAKWHIMKGIRKRSGVSSRAYSAGIRYDELPDDLKVPHSLDALTEDQGDGWKPRSTVDDFSHPLIEHLMLADRIRGLDQPDRIALVNSVGHLFTDEEIAEGLGVRAVDVAAFRERALRRLRCGA